MAVAKKSTDVVASLMRKTLNRQMAIAQSKLVFQPKQVEQILINYVKNKNARPYMELIKILQDFVISDENYKILLEDCLSSVVHLGRQLTEFVQVLCNLEWASRNEELVDLYSRFVISLVTAHTYHCPNVMSILLDLFKLDAENWEDSPPDKTVSKWSNIHTVIAQIIAIMPMASELLMETIIQQFPYYKVGCCTNRAYIYNLIWITKYIPSLTEQIITIIINRLVIIDVNIVDQTKNMGQLRDFEMDVDEQNDLMITLDYCMLEMLKWMESERGPILNLMCNVFERVLLPTYGIRHVQFLLLYTISINQQCADRVLSNLWVVAAGQHSLGPGAVSTRRTAASHLAGLLARCIRVPNTRLIHYLKTMADWCHSYITATQESSAAVDNIKVHGAFFAICHAIFYLVAFKHHNLFSSKENINFIESLNLARLVNCTLNPLKTCPPQVCRAFGSVTRSHQVVYCQAIIEKNARHTIQSTIVQYDEWFPYDPYTLPKSGAIIWPLCVEYKDWGKEGDDTQYTGMKRKLETEDDDYLIPSPSQKLTSSLSNSISPGFRTSESIVT